MVSKTRSFRVPRHPIGVMILLAAFAAAAGCSTAASNGSAGSVNHITAQGTSVTGWLAASGTSSHSRSAATSFVALGNAGGCTECHGADLLGGISRVSCMSNPSACHHGTVAGWVAAGGAPQEHGASAKRGPGGSSLFACRICHGNDFTGTVGAPSCLNNAACHGAGVVSPHPSRWRSSSGGAYNHDSTDTSNAANCYRCHAYSGTVNPNNPTVPASPAASGTAPGCFNGTMCHNNVAAPHASGAAWRDAGTGFHGTGAKADLAYCQGCHGTAGTINFDGGSAPTKCSTCHAAAKAHPTDWQGIRTINGVTVSHRTSGNRDVACAICHKTTGAGAGPNPSAPSCFSSSFLNAGGQTRSCHPGGPGTAPHALGSAWSDPAVGGSAFHGTTAKADLTYCQTCHGTSPRSFAGGTGATTACTTCHATAESHPTDWQGDNTYTHRSSGNRDVACALCHKTTGTGAGPNPSAPSCYSGSYTNGSGQNRGCHSGGPGAPSHPVPFFDNTAHTQVTLPGFTAGGCVSCHDVSGVSTKSGPVCLTCHISDPRGVTDCTSCHANPPDGAVTAYPNVAGAHTTHIALNGAGTCSTCHNGLGSGTLSHYNRTRPTRISPASVAVVSTYNAKGVTAAFDNSSLLRCTNVSCHGGQATPSWRTGAVDVVNACLSCHVSGTTQYNSYNSGKHSKHLSKFGTSAATCKRCHDATKVNVVGHFTNLATTTFEQTARSTLLTALGYNGTSCNPGAGGLSGCHSSENW